MEFRKIKYKGYEVKVSEDGKVVYVNGVLRKLIKNVSKRAKHPNYYVTLKLNKKALVQRLVALAFVPNPDNKPFVYHKNGHSGHNHYTNLAWGTRDDINSLPINRKKKQSPKLHKYKEIIRKRLQKGESLASIAKDFGVSDMSIFRLKKRLNVQIDKPKNSVEALSKYTGLSKEQIYKLVLLYLNKHTIRKTADIMGLTYQAVYYIYQRSRAKLHT